MYTVKFYLFGEIEQFSSCILQENRDYLNSVAHFLFPPTPAPYADIKYSFDALCKSLNIRPGALSLLYTNTWSFHSKCYLSCKNLSIAVDSEDSQRNRFQRESPIKWELVGDKIHLTYTSASDVKFYANKNGKIYPAINIVGMLELAKTLLENSLNEK